MPHSRRKFDSSKSGYQLIQTALDLKSQYNGQMTPKQPELKYRRPEFWDIPPVSHLYPNISHPSRRLFNNVHSTFLLTLKQKTQTDNTTFHHTISFLLLFRIIFLKSIHSFRFYIARRSKEPLLEVYISPIHILVRHCYWSVLSVQNIVMTRGCL